MEKLLCSLPPLRFLFESQSLRSQSASFIFSGSYFKNTSLLLFFCTVKNEESQCLCSYNARSLKKIHVAFIDLGISVGNLGSVCLCQVQWIDTVPLALTTELPHGDVCFGPSDYCVSSDF